MTPSIPVGELRLLGDRAFLIGVADATAARALAEELTSALGGEAEVVCGAATVMVHVTDADADADSGRSWPWLTPCGALESNAFSGSIRSTHLASSPFPVGSTGPIWTRWPRWRASGQTRWRGCSPRNH